MKKAWKIETCKYRRSIPTGETIGPFEAAVSSFKRFPPKGCGVITQITGPDGEVYYSLSMRVLKAAGFKVE